MLGAGVSLRIVVTVKYVPDATGDRHFADDLTVDRDDVDGLLSELDEYAVEQALQISENSDDDVEVTVLTVGPEDAKDALRKDAEAPIFELVDFGVVGDLFDVVPQLTEEINTRKG
ncbi:hypothetical protein [Streptomyces sp. NPDC056660]|uniref:hypothetical protein n=1 Tax=Streptomyces sp. NPDC056660 TaxID=3345897 RepID=UPI0036A0217D